ncbi:hypothetical protein INR49_024549, partial [Caranx melampygus]
MIVQSHCQSVVVRPRCLILPQIPCLTRGLIARRVNQPGTRHLIRTDSSCFRCLTALSQTAAGPSSSSRGGRCRSRRPQILQSAEGCLPRCRSGSLLHPSRCQMQYASCGRHRHQILNHCLFGVCVGERAPHESRQSLKHQRHIEHQHRVAGRHDTLKLLLARSPFLFGQVKISYQGPGIR